VSGWSRSLGAASSYAADTTDWTGNNADKFTTTGKAISNANYLEISGTWESLFGIPSGSTVTTIGTPDAFDYQVLTYTNGASSTAGPLELRDAPGTTLLLTLATGVTYTGTVARTTKAGTSQSVPSGSRPSATTVRLRLNATQATSASISGTNVLILGHVNITITYTTAYNLAGGTATLTLTGNSAVEKLAWHMAGATGALALAGNSAVEKLAWHMAGATGALALAGGSAGLPILRRLVGGTGHLALSGSSAGIVLAWQMAVDTGRFSAAGRQAFFPTNRHLVGDVGRFQLSGSDAELFRTHIIFVLIYLAAQLDTTKNVRGRLDAVKAVQGRLSDTKDIDAQL
jgi:hypothetical protein